MSGSFLPPHGGFRKLRSFQTAQRLVNQASNLLRNQIRRLEQDFLAHGGMRERMTRARLEARAAQEAPAPSETPACPDYGKPMRLSTAKTGPRTGRPFWGCTGYPDCTADAGENRLRGTGPGFIMIGVCRRAPPPAARDRRRAGENYSRPVERHYDAHEAEDENAARCQDTSQVLGY